MKQISLEEGVNILNAFRGQRAFDTGYKARLEGKPRDAFPLEMHIFVGKWVEGWWAADTDLLPKTDLLVPGLERRVTDVLSPPVCTVAPEVEVAYV